MHQNDQNYGKTVQIIEKSVKIIGKSVKIVNKTVITVVHRFIKIINNVTFKIENNRWPFTINSTSAYGIKM